MASAESLRKADALVVGLAALGAVLEKQFGAIYAIGSIGLPPTELGGSVRGDGAWSGGRGGGTRRRWHTQEVAHAGGCSRKACTRRRWHTQEVMHREVIPKARSQRPEQPEWWWVGVRSPV